MTLPIPRATLTVAAVLVLSLTLNVWFLIRAGARAEEPIDGVPRDDPCLVPEQPPPLARTVLRQSAQPSPCASRLGQVEERLASLRALAAQNRVVDEILRDSPPNPVATKQLEEATQRILGIDGGTKVPFQSECRDMACTVTPLREEDVTPAWISTFQASEWFRNHTDGQVISSPRRLAFKLAPEEVARLKANLRALLLSFRHSGSIQQCQSRFPHEPGTLAATIGVGGAERDALPGTDSVWAELEGDLIAHEVASCAREALARTLERSSLRAIPSREVSASSVLIARQPR